MNFEREVNSRMERKKYQLEKRSLELKYPANQSFKFAKFSKSSKPSQFSTFNQGNKSLMLSKEEQEEHVKKGLCFKCHKPGHRSFECPTIKRKIAAIEVEHEDGDESDGEPSKERVPNISTVVMNMEMEQEPTVLQIKGFLNSTFFSMILIDSGSTHNMMSVLFSHKIGLLLISVKSCLVWLPNNQLSFITHCVLRVPINIQRMNTEANFEIWDAARYEMIPGMAWLKEVDAWIAYKEGEVHGKLQSGKSFSIRGKRSLPTTPTLPHLQMKRCGRSSSIFYAYMGS